MERKWTPSTDEEILAQIAAADARVTEEDEWEPHAASARYDRSTGRIEIELKNGCFFAFPAESAQGLRGATPEQLEQVEVWGDGFALHWEELDADFTVPGLLAGRLGSRLWMREHARRAGSVKSSRKAAAARENGKKGGRPRKGG